MLGTGGTLRYWRPVWRVVVHFSDPKTESGLGECIPATRECTVHDFIVVVFWF
jgi:hypothetical protein